MPERKQNGDKMTVYFAHVWFEHSAMRSGIIIGWKIPDGPYKNYVIAYVPGERMPRVIEGGDDWHTTRKSAEQELARKIRLIVAESRKLCKKRKSRA